MFTVSSSSSKLKLESASISVQYSRDQKVVILNGKPQNLATYEAVRKFLAYQ